MKKTIVLLAVISSLFLLSKISIAQTPKWEWCSKITKTKCFTVDVSKNIFLANDSLTKIDSTRAFREPVKLGPNEACSAIAVDASGNIYLAGFTYTVNYTIDEKNGNPIYNYNPFYLFLKKYDANGNWSFPKEYSYKRAKGMLTSLAVDALRNTYMAGSFNSESLNFGNYNFMDNTDTTGNTSDLFIAKFDSAGNVKCLIHGLGNENDEAHSIAVDALGNIYVAGSFNSKTLNFYYGPDTLKNTDTTTSDLFIAKFDSDGKAKWVIQGRGDKDDKALSIAVDASGSIYVAGSFRSQLLNFGSDTLKNADTTGNASDLFLAKFDADGKAKWVKSAGGTEDDEAQSIALDASGKIYLTGEYKSSAIKFGTFTLSNTHNRYSALFLAKYDTNGNVLWTKSLGGNSREYDVRPSSITIDTSGNVYLVGNFNCPYLRFDSSSSNNFKNTLYSSGITYFIAKLPAK